MNIIVSAGSTIETINELSHISNMSSGMLGILITEEILHRHKDSKVFFVGSEIAIGNLKRKLISIMDHDFINHDRLEIIHITDTASVKLAIKELLEKENINSIIHSMAVAEYCVDKIYSLTELINKIKINDYSKEEIIELLENKTCLENDKKYDFDIRLIKTPRLIDFIKEYSPKTLLIGFKIFSGQQEEQIIRETRLELEESGADYIIAKDLHPIGHNETVGYIIDHIIDNKVIGKTQIARDVVDLISI